MNDRAARAHRPDVVVGATPDTVKRDSIGAARDARPLPRPVAKDGPVHAADPDVPAGRDPDAVQPVTLRRRVPPAPAIVAADGARQRTASARRAAARASCGPA